VPFAVQFFSMGSNAPHRPKPDAPKEAAVLLTTDQVIEMLQVSRSTVYELVDQGRLRPVKLGRLVRYSRSNIESMIGEPQC
jgi:excisionase family DNA binding protein